jgi:hypothetical protein
MLSLRLLRAETRGLVRRVSGFRSCQWTCATRTNLAAGVVRGCPRARRRLPPQAQARLGTEESTPVRRARPGRLDSERVPGRALAEGRRRPRAGVAFPKFAPPSGRRLGLGPTDSDRQLDSE